MLNLIEDVVFDVHKSIILQIMPTLVIDACRRCYRLQLLFLKLIHLRYEGCSSTRTQSTPGACCILKWRVERTLSEFLS